MLYDSFILYYGVLIRKLVDLRSSPSPYFYSSILSILSPLCLYTQSHRPSPFLSATRGKSGPQSSLVSARGRLSLHVYLGCIVHLDKAPMDQAEVSVAQVEGADKVYRGVRLPARRLRGRSFQAIRSSRSRYPRKSGL